MMSVSQVLRCVVVCVALVAGARNALGVNGGTPAPNTDRRFDAVGLFLTSTPWTCGGWVSGSCTLVGPNLVLAARHSLDITPADPLPTPAQRTYRVRFRRAADGTSENAYYANGTQCHGVYQEIDVVALIDAPSTSSDQVLCVLASAPVGIKPIGVEVNNPPLRNTNIILAGWGYDGPCYASGTPWVLRTSRGVLPDNSAGTDYLAFSACAVSTIAPCVTCAPGGPYVLANLHDSGAPILMEVPSTDPTDPTPELRLIGTVSSTNTARRPNAWNNMGGVPRLAEATASTHLRAGDFNGDGVVNPADLMMFLNAFFAGRMDTDANHDGHLSVPDVFAYVSAWFN